MTNKITCEQAKLNFNQLCQKIIDDKTEIIIEGRNGKDIALLAADELDSMKETIYLLKSPANASRLFEAFAEAESQILEPMTIDELFPDLDLDDLDLDE